MGSETVTIVVVALVMAIGLFGVVLPFVPGLPLIWLAALLYGLIEDFGAVGWVAMVLITLAMAGGIVAKVVLPQRRATSSGAPTSTLVVAFIAGIAGFFLIPLIGLPLGAVAGVLGAEYARTRDLEAAWASTKQVVVGFGLGALVEMGAGFVMIAIWVVWVLAR